MFHDLQFAYLVGDFFLFVVWIVLFLLRKDLRVKMLIMSILVAPLSPIAEIFYLRDYWQPEFLHGRSFTGIEDILFSFFIGGISGVLYEELFGKRFTKRKTRGHPIFFLAIFTFGVFWMIVMNLILGVNSMYASILGFPVLAANMLWLRSDLLKDAVLSGILLSALFFILYNAMLLLFPSLFRSWWMLENVSGVFISGIPIEEIFWAFTWGLFAGPAYEFIMGLKVSNRPVPAKSR